MSNSIKNRNRAYQGIIDTLPRKRRMIYQIIRRNPDITAYEISIRSEKPINEVSGRITELKEAFLIVETGSRFNNETRNNNTTYRVISDIHEREKQVTIEYLRLKNMIFSLKKDIESDVSEYAEKLIKKEITKLNSKLTRISKTLKQ